MEEKVKGRGESLDSLPKIQLLFFKEEGTLRKNKRRKGYLSSCLFE